MILDIRWETEEERSVVEQLNLDLLLYGEIHLTNANGITRLDPTGITYAPTGKEMTPGRRNRISDGISDATVA